VDSINTTTADAWTSVPFDTLIVAESTSGMNLGNDSTFFLVDNAGTYYINGCSHWNWQGADNSSIKILVRTTVNSVESRCLQANDTRGAKTTDDGSLDYGGTVTVAVGDTVRVQYYVTSTDMDFVGDPIFENPVAFSFNYHKISK
jgi:hypothetical protein